MLPIIDISLRMAAMGEAQATGELTATDRTEFLAGFPPNARLRWATSPRRGRHHRRLGRLGLIERFDELGATSVLPIAPGAPPRVLPIADAGRVGSGGANVGDWGISAMTPSGEFRWDLLQRLTRPGRSAAEVRREAGRPLAYLLRSVITDQPARFDYLISESPGSGTIADTPVAPATGLDRLADDLSAALTDIIAFAKPRHLGDRFDDWPRVFGLARAALDTNPKNEVGRWRLPSVFPAQAQHLFIAASESWVFGGAASWDDLTFAEPDRPEATELTLVLYDAVVAALCGACRLT